MTDLPVELRAALDSAVAGIPSKELSRSVDALIERYRAGQEAPEPILNSKVSSAAYAVYRMPATYAAIKSALTQFSLLSNDFQPRTMVDLGGGTGAALWAASEIWPSLTAIEVLERVPVVIELGKQLAKQAPSAAVQNTVWRQTILGAQINIPDVDVITMCYVLSELKEADRAPIVRRLAEQGSVVALIEPGTPAGYQRIIAARNVLLDAGMTIAAPCPHNEACPIKQDDWCHFATRINRTSLHRRIKGGSLGYEDEKFSYVIATRTPSQQAQNRVLRHPQRRKGGVTFTLCSRDNGLVTKSVFQSQGAHYRQAKDTDWGDAWQSQ